MEFTKEELITILHGLDAAADGAFTLEEQREYDDLADKIKLILNNK
jgi:hypothetical protein